MTTANWYDFFRLVPIMFGAFLIALVWLPYYERFDVTNDALVQSNEGVNGYEARYYSIVQVVLLNIIPEKYVPPYASRIVAMFGDKKFGFTPIIGNDVGKIKINRAGFIFLWVLSSCVLYTSAYFYTKINSVQKNTISGIIHCVGPTDVREAENVVSKAETGEKQGDISVKNQDEKENQSK